MYRFALLLVPVALLTVPLYPKIDTHAASVAPAATAPEVFVEPRSAAEDACRAASEEPAEQRRVSL